MRALAITIGYVDVIHVEVVRNHVDSGAQVQTASFRRRDGVCDRHSVRLVGSGTKRRESVILLHVTPFQHSPMVTLLSGVAIDCQEYLSVRSHELDQVKSYSLVRGPA